MMPIRAGLIALILSLSIVSASADPGADPGAPAEAVDAEASSTESLEGEVDLLQRQVQGMAGKLKESAAARKGAEQARMEAERRLAEVVQQNRSLDAELGLLRDARLALEVARDRAMERETKTNAALELARKSLVDLAAERDVQDRRVAELEHIMAGLEVELGACSADVQRLQIEIKATGNERDNLARRLEAMRSLVPTAEGGSLTLEAARDRAAEAAAALRASVEATAGASGPQGRRTLRDTEQELHRLQLAVARVSGARGVYRVRPHDALGLIARRIYGDSGRWREISEANRHVLSDPDHLIPGMTLVLP